MIDSPNNFGADLQKFVLLVRERQKAVFKDACAMAEESIQNGSAISGAPGQPVQTGKLLLSWQLRLDSDTQATIDTNSLYAPAIEDGVGKYGPLTLRASRGGFHSVKLTVAAWPQLIAAAQAKAAS